MNTDRYKYLYVNGSSISAGGGFEDYHYRTDVRDAYNKKGIKLDSQFMMTYSYHIGSKLGMSVKNEAKSGSGIRRLIRTSYEWINSNLDKINNTVFIFEIQGGVRLDIFLKEYNDYIIGNGVIKEDGSVPVHLVKQWYVQSNDDMQKLNDKYSDKFTEFQENFWSIDNEDKTELRELDMFISFCNELKLNYFISLNWPYNRNENLLKKIPPNRFINNFLDGRDIWSYASENKMLILNEVDNTDNHLGVSGNYEIGDKLIEIIKNEFKKIRIIIPRELFQNRPFMIRDLNYSLEYVDESELDSGNFDCLLIDGAPFRGVKKNFTDYIGYYDKFRGKVKKILFFLSNETYMKEEIDFIEDEISKHFSVEPKNIFVFDTTLYRKKVYGINFPDLELILKNYEDPLRNFNTEFNPFVRDKNKKLSLFVNKFNLYRLMGLDRLFYIYDNKSDLNRECYYSAANPYHYDEKEFTLIDYTTPAKNCNIEFKCDESYLKSLVPKNVENLNLENYLNNIQYPQHHGTVNKFMQITNLYTDSQFSLVFETSTSFNHSEYLDRKELDVIQLSEKTIIPILCGNLPFVVSDFSFYHVLESNGFDFSYLKEIFGIDYKNNKFADNVDNVENFIKKIKDTEFNDSFKLKCQTYARHNFNLMMDMIFFRKDFKFLDKLRS